MSEETFQSPINQNADTINEEGTNLRKVISLVIKHKYFFISAIVAALFIAFLYNTFTMPIYKVSAKLLIDDANNSTSSDNNQLLEGFGLSPGLKGLNNQIKILSSRTLLSKTLDELPFDLEYYYRGLIKKRSLYPEQPINLVFESGVQLPEEVEFVYKYMGNNMFKLDVESKDRFEIHKKISFGEKIELPACTFRIERKESGLGQDNGKRKICFMFHSRRKLIDSYLKRLKIDSEIKQGSVVGISLEGTNKTADLAFLNKLTEIFLNISLNKKNNEAIRVIQVIDDQLLGISDSLLLTENKLQQFRSKNMVMNLSAQGQVIIEQAVSLENEKARLGTEANYYNYLKEYLEKDEVGQVPIAPATVGIVDPGLMKLVADLADFQGRLYSKSMGDKNPLQNQLTQKIQNTKEALKEILRGLSRANNLALTENQEQINTINARASVLPKTERELLGIERNYKLNDQLYTFLLEKRSVAQMQKASNVADNEIIDPPEPENEPVRPNKPLIYLFALLAGIGFPLIWILLADVFNIRIKEIDEIVKITDVPQTGYIPRSLLKKNTTVLDEPNSPVAESFRLLRSRMKFFTKEVKAPVILVTSSMPKEGKTFTSINLASVYSLTGQKTVLVGFDLRQPMIYSDFSFDNEHGITTWLIGKDSLEDIIKKTSYDNLHIITSGPVPPNPAELTCLEKTNELFNLLKKKYDCIIIDSSPIGTVSDAFHLVSLADTCIIVVRQNLTYKDLLADTLKEFKSSNIKNFSLVINDIIPNGKPYVYGGRYLHSYNYKPTKNEEKKTSSSDKISQLGVNFLKRFQKS